jgi:hypothetical protein
MTAWGRAVGDRRVVAIPAEVGHVDPADEGDVTVDDHRLLVVAVEGMLTRIAASTPLPTAASIFEISDGSSTGHEKILADPVH